MARRLGAWDIHSFTPQCHWGSCLVGRRCPGEDEREAELDNTWASASAGVGGASNGGPLAPSPRADILARNNSSAAFPAPGDPGQTRQDSGEGETGAHFQLGDWSYLYH